MKLSAPDIIAFIRLIWKFQTIRLIPKDDIQAFRGLLKGANPENYRDRVQP
jgi:hypothetical protein